MVMRSRCRSPDRRGIHWPTPAGQFTQLWTFLFVVLAFGGLVGGMGRRKLEKLRQETVDMFYHGYDNYIKIAFPEDELRPISCVPLTRDREHPDNVGLNDVLGNYSLTQIDALSTLAVLASSPPKHARRTTALEDFQLGVRRLVDQYGDGTDGPSGRGSRGKGFDVDSKVQLFETVIRGVGGLLSAHLFAIGHLPIRGYKPDDHASKPTASRTAAGAAHSVSWSHGFQYNGQLLRLALDLAERLLPAFRTPTGIPYPRVNLKSGIQFYASAPAPEDGENDDPGAREITETCSAGAGSLVLEFATLSRLTGDARFETAAKRAFWQIWDRRSDIELVGGGIDAETGLWTSGMTGIGAGVDSFFEYAFKSHILLSGADIRGSTRSGHVFDEKADAESPDSGLDDSDAFLEAWERAHAAIKRHLYRDLHHPHYVNGHLSTGSPLALWVDSLGAYYPGLLTLAGEIEEAIGAHLLYSALWTRYAALPERWSIVDGGVEGGLGWWPGRPELVESSYHLYRATKDPWYLYVGEMILKDIKLRCWARCGWAGLQDVRSGEQSDRMESFFLGETIKYLFLLFDEDHPLNSLDAPFVFSTEGHPLIIPRRTKDLREMWFSASEDTSSPTCPIAQPAVPLTVSALAARPDLFHAASITRLVTVARNLTLERQSALGGSIPEQSDSRLPPAAYAFFPWTLPWNLVPVNGSCSKPKRIRSFEIQFPASQQSPSTDQQNIVRVAEGLVINNLGGLKLGIVLDQFSTERAEDMLRIYSIGHLALGRDEKVFIRRSILKNIDDPNFSLFRDDLYADVVVEVDSADNASRVDAAAHLGAEDAVDELQSLVERAGQKLLTGASSLLGPRELFSMVLQHFTAPQRPLGAPGDPPEGQEGPTRHQRLLAASATGVGACPLPDEDESEWAGGPAQAKQPRPRTAAAPEADAAATVTAQRPLPWKTVYLADESCDGKLPDAAAAQHHVVVIRRGRCSFSQKLANVPVFRPASRAALKLAVVVSDGPLDIRPVLDEVQHTPAGLVRFRPIPMVMVGGGQATYDLLARARAVGLRRRYHVQSQGFLIHNLVVI